MPVSQPYIMSARARRRTNGQARHAAPRRSPVRSRGQAMGDSSRGSIRSPAGPPSSHGHGGAGAGSGAGGMAAGAGQHPHPHPHQHPHQLQHQTQHGHPHPFVPGGSHMTLVSHGSMGGASMQGMHSPAMFAPGPHGMPATPTQGPEYVFLLTARAVGRPQCTADVAACRCFSAQQLSGQGDRPRSSVERNRAQPG